VGNNRGISQEQGAVIYNGLWKEVINGKHYRPIRPVFNLVPLKPKDLYLAPRNGGRLHRGIDLYQEKGAPIKASLDGVVVRAYDVDFGKYGKTVIIDHTSEILQGHNIRYRCCVYTLYAHLDRAYSYLLGQEVRQGDIIGTVGNTGNAKDMYPHLHFETIRSEVKMLWSSEKNTGYESEYMRVNPLEFLDGFYLPKEVFRLI
jgi:murein DD-endopeptidase MepM/ murein hydrolase activator NlpD